MRGLVELELGGASNVTSLEPLKHLVGLKTLAIDSAQSDLAPLASLTSLKSLTYGNSSPGSDKVVKIPDLTWIRSLTALEDLWLPGTSFEPTHLEDVAAISSLRSIRMPIRRKYRKKIFELAETNAAFQTLADVYKSYDEWVKTFR